jgi:uncharacterized membrane protein
MKTMHKLIGVLAGLAGFSAVGVARASNFDFCNDGPNRMFIAMGELGDGNTFSTGYFGMHCNDFQSPDGDNDAEWVDWFQVDPGNCIELFRGCYTNDNFLWFAEDTAGHFWAGAGFNDGDPDWSQISSSQHFSDCCVDDFENTGSQFANVGPGIEQCRSGWFPDAQESFGPRVVGNLRPGFAQVCANSFTIPLTCTGC